MLLTRSASSPLPSPLSLLAFLFFLQNVMFLHLFFLLSGVEAGADVDASSLPRTPPGAEADGEQQHASALRRNFLPLLHLLAADVNRPIVGPTRDGQCTLGLIRARRVARFLGDTSTLTRAPSGRSGRPTAPAAASRHARVEDEELLEERNGERRSAGMEFDLSVN